MASLTSPSCYCFSLENYGPPAGLLLCFPPRSSPALASSSSHLQLRQAPWAVGASLGLLARPPLGAATSQWKIPAPPRRKPQGALQHPSQCPHGAAILLSVVATPWEHAQHHPRDVGAGIKGGL